MSVRETFVKAIAGAAERLFTETGSAAAGADRLATEGRALLASPAARAIAPTPELADLRKGLGYQFAEADKSRMAYPTMSGFSSNVSFRSAIKAAIEEAKVTEAKDRLPVMLNWAKKGEDPHSVFVFGDSSVTRVKWDWRGNRDDSIINNRMAGIDDNRSMSFLGRAQLGISNALFKYYARGL